MEKCPSNARLCDLVDVQSVIELFGTVKPCGKPCELHKLYSDRTPSIYGALIDIVAKGKNVAPTVFLAQRIGTKNALFFKISKFTTKQRVFSTGATSNVVVAPVLETHCL